MYEFSAEYVIAIIGVIVAGITIFLSDRRMKKANEITMAALNETKRLHAIELIKNKPKLVLENASYDPHEQENVIEFTAKLTNNGEIPASNIRYNIEITNYPYQLEHFKKDALEENNGLLSNNLPTLLKHETHIIEEVEDFSFESEFVCVALWIRYDFLDEKNHQEIFFHYFQKGVSPHAHYTLHHEDIENGRKQ